MRFYQPRGFASVVWHPVRKRAIARFIKRQYETDDPDVIQTLTEMGYHTNSFFVAAENELSSDPPEAVKKSLSDGGMAKQFKTPEERQLAIERAWAVFNGKPDPAMPVDPEQAPAPAAPAVTPPAPQSEDTVAPPAPAAPAGPAADPGGYDALKIKQLKVEAKARGLKGISAMHKAALVVLLNQHDLENKNESPA